MRVEIKVPCPTISTVVASFVKSIEEDTAGWDEERRRDLELEFELSAERANEIFRHFCKSDVSRAFFEAEAARAAARRAERAAREAPAEELLVRRRAAQAGSPREARAEGDNGAFEELFQLQGMAAWPAAAAANAAELGSAVEACDLRACPHCMAPIEKNGGCDHMSCRMCRRDFWWGDARPRAMW